MSTLSVSERNSLLNILVDVDDLIEKCQPLYEKYEALDQQKEEAKDTYAHIWFARNVGIAVSAICILLYLAGIRLVSEGLLLTVGVIALAATVYLWIKTANWKKEWPGLRNEYRRKQQALLDEIDELYEKSPVKGVYPQRYVFAEASDYCYDLIENMRADSIKEAINLYEDELYKLRMESMQKSAEKAQREAAESLRNIEIESKKTRKAAQFAAVASGISAYNSHKIKKRITQ